MQTKTLSSDIMGKLTHCLINEIQSKILEGITYILITKDNKEKIEHYLSIKKEIMNSGYGSDEILRVYEVTNGYIFDVDMNIFKYITRKLSEKSGIGENIDIIENNPEIRRSKDLNSLAVMCKKKFSRERISEFEVGLFSRNTTNTIRVCAVNSKNVKQLIGYPAYAIRHWDLEEVNHILHRSNIRISKIQPCEILPSKTGVRFILTLSSV